MAEAIWKWIRRVLLTIILLLVIGLLSLAVATVPRVWNVVDQFGEVVESVERTSRSIHSTSEKASDAIDEWSEQQ